MYFYGVVPIGMRITTCKPKKGKKESIFSTLLVCTRVEKYRLYKLKFKFNITSVS